MNYVVFLSVMAVGIFGVLPAINEFWTLYKEAYTS